MRLVIGQPMRGHRFAVGMIWLGIVMSLSGCSSTIPLTISPAEASVRLGTTLALTAQQLQTPVLSASWTVIGGAAYGSIDENGIYTPPQAIPPTNVVISCQAAGQTVTATIAVLNPTPAIRQVTPATAVELTTAVIIVGEGFVSGSQVLVGGVAVPTTVIDGEHVAATLLIASSSVSSLTLSISNPSPGAISSNSFSLPVAIAPISIAPQPASVRLGGTLALSGIQLGGTVSGGTWSVAGGPASGSITSGGLYTPPSSIPTSAVTVMYQALGQTASTTLTVLNPVPVISQISPSKLTELSTAVTVSGSGFVSGAELLVDGALVPTTVVDGGHLLATLNVPSIFVSSLTLTISNPSPGAIASISATLPVSIAPLEISPQGGSVRVGNVLNLVAQQQGATVSGGVWAVLGGPASGSIDQNGVYSPPAIIPASGTTVTYQALGQTATTAITVQNPVPTITQLRPATLTEISTTVTVTGTGFVSGSQIQAGGTSIATTFTDGQHLSGTVVAPNISIHSLGVSVVNPNPGLIVSSPIAIPVAISPLTITPTSATVRLGATLSLTGVQQGASLSGGTWSVIGGPASGSITSSGIYTPPNTVPASAVTVTYQAVGQTATSTLAICNPIPSVAQTNPLSLAEVSSSVTVIGAGFVAGSQILIGGAAIPTVYLDGDHVSGTIVVPSLSVKSVSLSVANPAPGPAASNSINVPVSIAPLRILPQGASVRLGTSLSLNGLQQATSVTGGTWSVIGGPANGSINQSGIFTPPLSIPPSLVTATYAAVGQTASTSITILNPTPLISQINPSALTELNMPITLTASGLVNGSRILVNGSPIATTFIDSAHVSGLVSVPNISVVSVSVAISNPDPGGNQSPPAVLPVNISPLQISSPNGSVRIGDVLALAAEQNGAAVSGAVWAVSGGSVNGSIGPDGVYNPPSSLPGSPVTINCQALGQMATSTIEVLNPLPVVEGTTPTTLVGLSTAVTVAGSGFVKGSQLAIDGVAVPTTFVDSGHLSSSVLVSKSSTTAFTLTVTNPAPGEASSNVFTLAVSIRPLTVSPQPLLGGNITITASIPSLPAGSIVTLDGLPLTTVSTDSASITATGYLPFWRSGSTIVAVAPPGGVASFAQVDVPITPTAVPYDVASRFAVQAGFGPRHDIIEHIQQIGLSPFVDEQLQTTVDSYTDPGDPPHLFEQYAVNNNTQLRLRTAWAFQSFMPGRGIFLQESTLPWEQTLEADGFGNFRQILLDVASDPNVTTLLNLPGNASSSDPNVHPNQNFARELLQLFSIGTVMLNDDGTIQTDVSGNPMPAYGQDTILDISRALTGWNYAPPVNPRFTFYGIDYSQTLVPVESEHDEGAKTIFGGIQLAAGQTAVTDRNQVLDAVFQHKNVPPFISRRLIQRFVKSEPSPAYIGRISSVFEDDGLGVRGNLAAVIKAILLDPEARAGDSAPSDSDGFVQDSLFAEIFAMQLMSIDSTNDVPAYYPSMLGEPVWFSPTVFAYYSPDYVIPGTTINSPESQLLTTTLIVQRSQFLWGMINGPQAGFGPWGPTWLSQTFATVPSLVDALNHVAYHGNMPPYQQTIITDYCSGLADWQSQADCTLLLALSGSSYTVVQ